MLGKQQSKADHRHGRYLAAAVPVEGAEVGGVVVLRAEGTLPSLVPGVPGLPVRLVARMSKEERL